jgi:hypothetical protein
MRNSSEPWLLHQLPMDRLPERGSDCSAHKPPVDDGTAFDIADPWIAIHAQPDPRY